LGEQSHARRLDEMKPGLECTAGGLVFAGEPTGEFNALDAATSRLLWKSRTGSGIHSNPVTYSVRGKQSIAVPTGRGWWLKGFAIDSFGTIRGSALMVFALPGEGANPLTQLKPQGDECESNALRFRRARDCAAGA
jgi:outer membrane protein assembly factor BamB